MVGKLFGKYLTSASSDPSARTDGRAGELCTHARFETHELLPTPTLQPLIFPGSILHSTEPVLLTAQAGQREEGRSGGVEEGRVILMLLLLCSALQHAL